MTISDCIAHQPWPKVTSKVDRVARLPAKASANAKDQEEQA